jgi:hypothetical protein
MFNVMEQLIKRLGMNSITDNKRTLFLNIIS